MSDNLADVEAALRQYGTACNEGDFEAWIALWDQEGRQMPPDAPTRIGVAAIGEAMKPVFDALNIEFSFNSVDEVTDLGDVALTRCTYSIFATPKDGGERFPVMADGKALTLFRQQADGRWKILFDCFNASTPPNV
ncbi:MAG: DUF4440 domain-containing protein [Pseudomonadota bacterium]